MPLGRSNSPTHRKGSHAEDLASEYLQAQGLTVVARNWHMAGVGEIDLIMQAESSPCSVLVFVEVRQRQYKAYGGAAASITPAKRRKIMQTAAVFLAEYTEYDDVDCRFDVVAIENQDIHWYPAAFMLDV